MASVRTAAASQPSSAGEEPRERILAAAGREFAERGYEAATVRDICLKANVNIAAVNYYFGDKRRLYIESVKHAHQQRVAQVPLPDAPADRPAADRLHDFVATMLERMLGASEQPWQLRLMLREILQPTDACREMVEDYMRPHFALLVSILDEVCEHRLQPAELRRVAMGIIGQCFVYRAAGDVIGMLVPEAEIRTLHTPTELAAHVTRSALAALGAGPSLTAMSSSPSSVSAHS